MEPNMILYDENLNEGLLEFGIQIPMLASRAVKAYEFLKSHDILGPKIDQWHIPKIEEQITKADLLRVHSSDYVDKLYSADLESEIIRTFDLVDEQGKYYRYDPDAATLPLTHLFDRTLTTVASTVQCSRVAQEKNFCFAFRGGMHHAQHNYGAGFCPVNDIVISIRKLQAENRLQTAWVIDTDLSGVFRVAQAAVRALVDAGTGGSIVNIASILGITAAKRIQAYSASKAGLIALTKSLGKETADMDIAVNAITPAAAKTAIFDQITQQHIDYMLAKIPRNRFVKVEELASMAAWLASDENSFTTGAVFDLSGGRATY